MTLSACSRMESRIITFHLAPDVNDVYPGLPHLYVPLACSHFAIGPAPSTPGMLVFKSPSLFSNASQAQKQ